MAQRESRLSRKIQDALMAEGYFCWKNHGTEYTMAGLPDIIACVEGYLVGFEVKLPESRGDVRPTQRYIMGRIDAAGGYTAVITSPGEAVRLCRELLDRKKNSQ